MIIAAGCTNQQPRPINTSQDICAYCKMGISDLRFAGELITSKGKVYKFDSIECLAAYYQDLNSSEKNNVKLWVHNFLRLDDWLAVNRAIFLRSGQIHSPMSLDLAAVGNDSEKVHVQQNFDGVPITWQDLLEYVDNNME